MNRRLLIALGICLFFVGFFLIYLGHLGFVNGEVYYATSVSVSGGILAFSGAMAFIYGAFGSASLLSVYEKATGSKVKTSSYTDEVPERDEQERLAVSLARRRSLMFYLEDLGVVAPIAGVVDAILIYVLNAPSSLVLFFSALLLILLGCAGMGSGRWSAADVSIAPGWAKGNPEMLREDVKNIGSRKPKRSVHYLALLTVGITFLILYFFAR